MGSNSLGLPQGAFTNYAAQTIASAIAGAGFGTTGNIYYCDPVNGNNQNNGTAPQPLSPGNGPVQSLAAGYALLSEGHNDVLVLIGNGLSSGSARISATFAWAKDAAHLIGVCAPSRISQRARIAPPTTAAAFATFFTVSGNGCLFSNISWFHGFGTGVAASICMTVSGSRNVFQNCDIEGMGDTTASASSASRNLLLTAGENYFSHCNIGLDTIARTAANASVEIKGNSARNIFENCIFPSFIGTSGTGALVFLTAGAAAIDRYTIFKDCMFINAIQSSGLTMTAGFTLAASSGGMIVLKDCFSAGITTLATDATSLGQMYAVGPTPVTGAFLATNVTS